MKLYASLFLVLLCLLPAPALAEEYEPPTIILGDQEYPQGVKDRGSSPAVLSPRHRALKGLGDKEQLRIVLDDLTPRRVQQLLGATQIIRWGENREHMLCYVSSTPGDGTGLFFYEYASLIYMAGVLADSRQLLQAPGCRRTPAVHQALRTPGGLRLGMTRTEVERMFGPPQRTVANKAAYSAERQEPPLPGQQYGRTDSRSVNVWYDDHDVVTIFTLSWSILE